MAKRGRPRKFSTTEVISVRFTHKARNIILLISLLVILTSFISCNDKKCDIGTSSSIIKVEEFDTLYLSLDENRTLEVIFKVIKD